MIIPVGNEIDISNYQQIYYSFEERKKAKLIWVSENKKLNSWLEEKCAFIVHEKGSNRAYRINKGIEHAEFDSLLLNHPRSILSYQAIDQYENLLDRQTLCWGGFTHEFMDSNHFLLKFTSWYSNRVRVDIKNIIYLDHCIYFNKTHLGEVKKIPEIDIFEDTVLSEILDKTGPPLRLRGKSRTSAVRFLKNGIYRQAVLNQIMKIGFLAKYSNGDMNEVYEKGLWLN